MRTYFGLVDDTNPPKNYNRYLWADSGCIRGIAWCRQNHREYEVLPTNFPEIADARNAEQYLQKMQSTFMARATSYLNQYHLTNYSAASWNVLIWYWLGLFMETLYDKYLRLCKIRDIGIEASVRLYRTDMLTIPVDFMDHKSLLYKQEDAHKYLYSLLYNSMDSLTGLRVEGDLGTYTRRALENPLNEQPEKVLKYRSEYAEYKKKTGLLDDVVLETLYLKFDVIRDITAQAPGRISPYFEYYLLGLRNEFADANREIDLDWRIWAGSEYPQEVDEFGKIAWKLLWLQLPYAYLEGFKRLSDTADKMYQYARSPKAIIYDASILNDDEVFKRYLMDMLGNDTLKCSIQHGGYCFTSNANIFYEAQISDILFYCGRLSDQYLDKVVPMPFPKFFWLDAYPMDKSRILYVNYACKKHFVSFAGMDEVNRPKYIEKELRLLHSMDAHIRQKLVIRLYDPDDPWNYRETVGDRYPEIGFDNEQNFYTSLSESSLVICEVWATTTIEALFCDIPVLVLNDPQELSTYPIEYAKKDIEALRAAGIIASSPEQLANIINCHEGNLEEWWREPERQEVVQRIKKKYCYFPPDAKERWMKKIAAMVCGEPRRKTEERIE